MHDRVGFKPAQVVEWKFQVEQQGFMTRYGKAGDLFFKQTILPGKTDAFSYPVKRISEKVYETALRVSTALK